MTRWWVLLFVGACAPEIDLSRPEDAPVASILTPTDGSSVPSGSTTLLGRVSDPQDDAEYLFAVWSLGDADGRWVDVCDGFAEADGTTRCTTELEPEHTRIRLLVKDLAGFQRLEVVDVDVFALEPPVVEILSPIAPGPFHTDVVVRFEATVDDPDDAPADLTVTWRSNLAGVLVGPDRVDVSGRLEGALQLAEGHHEITLTVTDPSGGQGRDVSTIRVRGPNTPPTATIESPDDEAGIYVGTTVSLQGRVLDVETSLDALDAVWSSHMDGELARPTPDGDGHLLAQDVTLTQGDHVLTLQATDEMGATGQATRTVHVDTPPTLSVTSPVDQDTFGLSSPVLFDATATDALDGEGVLRVAARSDVDGPLFDLAVDAEGDVAASVQLSPTDHVITVVATDRFGLETHEQIELIFSP